MNADPRPRPRSRWRGAPHGIGFSRGSIGLTVLAIVLAVLLFPTAVAAVASPLPTGAYAVDVDGAAVHVSVDASGEVAVSAADGVVVTLDFDDDGRVLDRFRARTADASYEVEVKVQADGSYSVAVVESAPPVAPPDDDTPTRAGVSGASQPRDEVATNHGELVSAVARCAPRGAAATSAGWPNHGTVVSAAASGLPLKLPVPDPLTGAQREITADLGSVGGVIAFCDLADIVGATRESQVAHTVD